MALKIRLARGGAKKAGLITAMLSPKHRRRVMVVFVERLGSYNPMVERSSGTPDPRR